MKHAYNRNGNGGIQITEYWEKNEIRSIQLEPCIQSDRVYDKGNVLYV